MRVRSRAEESCWTTGVVSGFRRFSMTSSPSSRSTRSRPARSSTITRRYVIGGANGRHASANTRRPRRVYESSTLSKFAGTARGKTMKY